MQISLLEDDKLLFWMEQEIRLLLKGDTLYFHCPDVDLEPVIQIINKLTRSYNRKFILSKDPNGALRITRVQGLTYPHKAPRKEFRRGPYRKRSSQALTWH